MTIHFFFQAEDGIRDIRRELGRDMVMPERNIVPARGVDRRILDLRTTILTLITEEPTGRTAPYCTMEGQNIRRRTGIRLVRYPFHTGPGSEREAECSA